jgi:YD repeat-containing protein
VAFQAEIIPITLRTGAGTQTISHIRYPTMTAKAAIFVCADNSGTNSEIWSVGIDDGTNRIGTGIGLTETFGVCLTARGYSTVYSMITEQAQAFFGGAQRRMSANVTAFNVGSFDIDIDINNTPGAQWYAIVIGGDDISCAVGHYDASSGSGFENVGFDPIAIFKVTSPDLATDGEVAGAYTGFGFATLCSTDQVAFSASAGSISSNANSFQMHGLIGGSLDPIADTGGATVREQQSIGSYAANGFNFNCSVGDDWGLGYLAIGGDGVSANLVSITQPTSTGVQNTAIEARDPELVLFGSTGFATQSTVHEHLRLTLGAYDGVSTLSQWIGLQDLSSFPYQRDRRSSTTNAITFAAPTGASTSSLQAEASCALSLGNIALNWTTVDATQREIWALVLANNPTPGLDNPCGDAGDAGTIIVTKETDPSGSVTDFNFTGSGALGSFTLSDGESQTFEDVPVGSGYSIVEDTYPQWTTTYDVSTAEPNTNFTVSVGQTVTITVLNERTFEQSGETVQWRIHRFDIKYSPEEQS